MIKGQDFYDVDEFHECLGGPPKIAKGTIYNALKNDQIPHVSFGRRILIPRWYVEKITQQPG